MAKLAAISFGLLVLAACGSGGSSPEAKVVPARPLKAEVCTEGEARSTKLYVRNLDDFEWRDISISLVKDGETYAREWASLSSESQQASEPFADSTQFSFLRKVERIKGSSSSDLTTSAPFGIMANSDGVLRLHNFSGLESATIAVSEPQPGEWAGDVHPCE